MVNLQATIQDLRAKAHMLGQEALHHPNHCQVKDGCYLCEAERVKLRNMAKVESIVFCCLYPNCGYVCKSFAEYADHVDQAHETPALAEYVPTALQGYAVAN